MPVIATALAVEQSSEIELMEMTLREEGSMTVK
jgi:hypothetical protein